MMLAPAIGRQPGADLLGSGGATARGLSVTDSSSAPVRLVVMEGDGIGPEITAATLAVLRAADRAFGLGLSFTPVHHRPGGVARAGHHPARRRGRRRQEPPTASSSGRCRTTTIRRSPKAASIRRAHCAQRSICSPISVRRAAAAAFRRAAARRSISWSRARTPKASTPTARCSWARASSCRRPTSRSRCARSRAPARPGSRRRPSRSPCDRRRKVTAVHKANVLRVSDGLFLECVRAVAARFPAGAIRGADHRRDGGAAGARRQRVRRDRHHQHVRRHPVRSRRPRSAAASGSPPRSMPATEHAVAQAQHGSAPDIAGQDRANPASLIGSAAMLLAWLGERRKDGAIDARRRRHRGGARPGDRHARMAHARPRRPARHQGVRRARGGVGEGSAA